MGRRSAARYVGDGSRSGNQVDRKATACVYAEGRMSKEWRMGLTVQIWKRKGDGHDAGK